MAMELATPEAAQAADRVLECQADLETAMQVALSDLLSRSKTSDPHLRDALSKAIKDIRRGHAPSPGSPISEPSLVAFCGALERKEAATKIFYGLFSSERLELTRRIQGMAGLPRLREAVTWQNKKAVETGFDSLIRQDPAMLRSRDRQHEALVASYVQRYTTKNDTIGFFGPVAWARLSNGHEILVAKPERDLIAAREVYFEQWGIDAVAAKLSSDRRLAPWMPPRRLPFIRIDGTVAISPLNGTHRLTEAQAVLLLACNGERTARQIAQEFQYRMPSTYESEQDVFAELAELADRKLLVWTFEVPLRSRPDHALRDSLAQIQDVALRASALSALEGLETARQAVAKSAGNWEQLGAALGALDRHFTELSELPSSRGAGTMYAARQLTYEDCRRGISVELGGKIVDDLGPALSLVLDSARWFTWVTAQEYTKCFRMIYSDLASSGTTVRVIDLWFRAQRLLFGSGSRPIDAVVEKLQRKWSDILSLPGRGSQVQYAADGLRMLVSDAFDVSRPGWPSGRYHSPDIMLAAESIDAVKAGDYLLVLGELHASLNTLNYSFLFDQHSDRETLGSHMASDLPEIEVIPIYAKDSPKMTARMSRPFASPWSFYLETGFDRAPGPRDKVVSLAELMVEDKNGALVTSLPNGHSIPLVELFGRTLGSLTAECFKMFGTDRHMPRLSIDRLVIRRETWTLPARELTFASQAEEAERFLSARRWARSLKMPRVVFAKSPMEGKPIYVDFDSPLQINLLAKQVRAVVDKNPSNDQIVLTEMLPSTLQAWLPDADGHKYTSELRVVAVDARR
jgi:hypothetical protein